MVGGILWHWNILLRVVIIFAAAAAQTLFLGENATQPARLRTSTEVILALRHCAREGRREENQEMCVCIERGTDGCAIHPYLCKGCRVVSRANKVNLSLGR